MEVERVKDSGVVEVSNSADPEVPEKPRRAYVVALLNGFLSSEVIASLLLRKG